MEMNAEMHSVYNCSVDEILHTHWLHIRPLSYVWHLVFAIVGLVAFLGGLMGNILVLLLFVRHPSLRSFSNLLVLNLTIADSILCVGTLPMLIIASFSGCWVFGVIGCQVYGFVGAVAGFASINTFAAISLDRCLVIVRTFPSRNRISVRYCFISIAFIWCYSTSWAAAPLFGWGKFILEGTNTSCTFDYLTGSINNKTYVMGIIICQFCIQVTMIIGAYCLISNKVAKNQRQLRQVMQIHGQEGTRLRKFSFVLGMKQSIKTAKVSAIVILVFCISWLPYAMVALLGLFGNRTFVTRLSSGIPGLCAKFSTTLNPLIYTLLHPKYREKLFNIFRITTDSDNV